jgi:hypothetical protein
VSGEASCALQQEREHGFSGIFIGNAQFAGRIEYIQNELNAVDRCCRIRPVFQDVRNRVLGIDPLPHVLRSAEVAGESRDDGVPSVLSFQPAFNRQPVIDRTGRRVAAPGPFQKKVDGAQESMFVQFSPRAEQDDRRVLDPVFDVFRLDSHRS